MKITVGADRDRRALKGWQRTLTDQGGLNSFGSPNYRIRWGYEDVNRYSAPERWLERWHLEWWHPVSRDYERLATFEEGITKEFMEPTVALLLEAVSAHQQTMRRTFREIRAKIEAEVLARENQGAEKKVGLMEEAQAAFPFKSWMPVSGPLTAESRRKSEFGG